MTRVKLLAAAIAVIVGSYVAFPFAFTVVPIDEDGASDEVFDPVIYVDGVWDQINTTIRDDAIDLAVILGAIRPGADGRAQKDDLTAVAEQYGLITAGEAHVYRVRASGTVTAADVDTSLGTVELAVDGYDGPIVVNVYVGTRIPSDESSIRDAVGFIRFGDFREQTEYGKVAAEINKRVIANLSGLDRESLVGASIEVVGAMTIRTFNLVEIDVRTMSIVPIAVDIR